MILIVLLISLLPIVVQSQAQASESSSLMDRVWLLSDKNAIKGSAKLKAVHEIGQNSFGKPIYNKSLLPFRRLAFTRKRPNLDIIKYYSPNHAVQFTMAHSAAQFDYINICYFDQETNELSCIVIMVNETTPSRQLNKYPLNQWKTNMPNTIQY